MEPRQPGFSLPFGPDCRPLLPFFLTFLLRGAGIFKRWWLPISKIFLCPVLKIEECQLSYGKGRVFNQILPAPYKKKKERKLMCPDRMDFLIEFDRLYQALFNDIKEADTLKEILNEDQEIFN